MNAGPPGLLRTVLFGALDGGPWGAAWSADSDLVLLAGSPEGPATPLEGVRLSGSAVPGETWRLTGPGLTLEVSGQGEASSFADDGQSGGFVQLCRVQGAAARGDGELAIDVPGVRVVQAQIDRRSADSVRQLGVWFEQGDGIAVAAVRPRKSRGHAADEVQAALLDPAAGVTAVSEPRLSTTYAGDGTPLRAGLELWLEDENEPYPRRAAGSAVSAARVEDQGFELRAILLRWRHRGRPGTGVYLLAQPR